MKKCVLCMVVCLLLSGCGAQDTFETVADEWVQSAAAPMGQVILTLPEEAAVPVSQGEDGTLYLCDGYEIQVQTLPAGDLEKTVQTVTGFELDRVTWMQTQQDGFNRYDLVWSTLGETGEQVGRAAILDDRNYHYVLSVLAQADRAGEQKEVFRQLFESYGLEPY